MLGEALGNYRIIRRLGIGGMGTVYLAEHTLIGRKAAVKVLNSQYSHNKLIVQRFFNEAKAATAVRHPGIVEIYDFGYGDDGKAYIVMEFLEGESVKKRMRRLKWFPEGHVLNFARQIASALSSAHKAGIVHRDLKPDNLYVITDPDMPGGERIKVLDFGIAKFNEEGTGPSIKTRTGIAMGTPAYMSPEQCKGAGRVDHRADLYSIGVIMFELLAGTPPFVAEGGGEVMAQHIYEQPPTVAARGGSCAEGTQRIITKLLAKQAGQRFQNAAELMKAIDEVAGRMPRAITQDGPLLEGPWELGESSATTVPNRAATPVLTLPDEDEAEEEDGKPTTLTAAAGATSPSQLSGEELGALDSPWKRIAIAGAALAAVVVAGVFVAKSGGESEPSSETRSASAEEPGASAGDPQPSTDDPQPSTDDPQPSSDEPRSEDREPGAENRDPSTGNREPRTETREPRTENRDDDGAPVLPEPIEIVIDSEPSGASVYQMPASVRIGQTPYTYSGPPVSGELVFVIRHGGYEEQTVAFPANESAQRTVELEREQRVSASKSRSRSRSKSSSRSRSKTKSTKTKAKPTEPKPKNKSRSLNPFEK